MCYVLKPRGSGRELHIEQPRGVRLKPRGLDQKRKRHT